ncbi:5679_t:CDS:2 [Cetraspora pellucida]|uniref:5679_t:CDS:1 n=1 Tax=Cetraspora pellucida TaxID=1433469 RepID=A0A9N9HYQ2_9GLOM|nr:5679_t:CDS:2 [Cetraspora pellucida]
MWLNKDKIITSKRGHYAKIRSLLLHEDFKLQVTEYLHTHKFTLRIAEFVKFIENEAIPALEIEEKITISHTTAREWLHKLVAYQHEFLQKFAELQKRMTTYEGENLDQIIPSLLLPEIVSITQDESLFYAKDEKKCAMNDLLPDNEQLIYTEVCVVMHPDTNRDGCCNYNTFPDDALVVTRMNMKDGGKQPLLHNGQKPDSSTHIIMFTDIDSIIIEAAGHMCMFYLKFYCELNYIESFWSETKRYSRLHYDYTFKGLQEVVLHALESISLMKICRFAHHSECYMSAYEVGLIGKAAVFAVKWYRSHCYVPTSVLEEFGDVNQ